MKATTHLFPTVFSFSFACFLLGCSNEPPEGSFHLPQAHSSYLPGDKMLIEASVKDEDGSVANVEFQLNGSTVASLDASPYDFTYEVTEIPEGNYALTGVATDNDGNTGSWEVHINILSQSETFTDPRDGNVYRYRMIDDKEWMIDNLAWLPSVSPSSTISDSMPIYYVSEYQGTDIIQAKATDNYSIYGVLYNKTAADSCCPAGWHLPSKKEWMELESYIDAQQGPFNKSEYEWGYVWWELGHHLLHTSGWDTEEHNGLNTYGFSAVPGGIVNYEPLPHDCPFATAGDKSYADWWSSTATNDTVPAWGLWSMYPGNMGIHLQYPKGFGLSVRCIKNK